MSEVHIAAVMFRKRAWIYEIQGLFPLVKQLHPLYSHNSALPIHCFSTLNLKETQQFDFKGQESV